jgi:hypothetical protein
MVRMSDAESGARIHGVYADLLHVATHGSARNRTELPEQQGLDFPRAIEWTVGKQRVNAVLDRHFAR